MFYSSKRSLDAYKTYKLLINTLKIKPNSVIFEEQLKTENFMKCVLICKSQLAFNAVFDQLLHNCACSAKDLELVVGPTKARELVVAKLKGQSV